MYFRLVTLEHSVARGHWILVQMLLHGHVNRHTWTHSMPISLRGPQKLWTVTSNKCIAVRKVATLLRELTCHMGSHSVTCHPTEVTFPGVSGWMFLLVPPYLGCPGPKAIKQLCVFVWQFVIDKLLFCVTHRIIHWANISILVTQGLIWWFSPCSDNTFNWFWWNVA